MTMRIPVMLVMLLALGCATAPRRAATPPPSIVQSSESCSDMGHQLVTLAPDAQLETAVQTVACAGRLARVPAAADRWYVRRHQQFDEHSTSALEIATMILAFTQEGMSHLTADLESFGYIYNYGRELSVSRVEKQVRDYPDDVSQQFLTRLQWSLAKLKERAGRLHGRDRAIFVDFLSRARREYLAQAKAVASFEPETTALLHSIDSALEGAPTSDQLSHLTHEAERLRESVLIRCTDRRPLQGCLDGPLVRPLSERLVSLAQAAGDVPRAEAEREQLRQGADRSTLAKDLDAELHHALSAQSGNDAAGAHEATDADAMTAALSEPGAESMVSLTWGVSASTRPEAEPAQSPQTVHVEGVVKGYQNHPGGMGIVLESGEFVVLPVAEARLLKIGEKLEAIVDRESKCGVVLYAHHYRLPRIVQFRGTRLGGTRGVQAVALLGETP